MSLPSGATIGGYTILRLLGQGGMGSVYLAQHPRLPRLDALKVLHAPFAVDPTYRARFEYEAKLAARLDHPNIVRVIDSDAADGHLWISMQFVDGVDAASVLRSGPLSPDRARHITRSIAAALDHAHRAGLWHRDVKPANIMLAPSSFPGEAERVLLTDFGIAKAEDATARLTMTGQALLTPGYAAPERFDSAPVDHRVDVYALGCVLFELLTGQLPFPHESFFALMRAHDQDQVPDPASIRPSLPPALASVVRTALAKNRDERYQSCQALADAMEAAFAAPTRRQPPPPPPPVDPRPAEGTTVVGPAQRYPAGPHRVSVGVRTVLGGRVRTLGTLDTMQLIDRERRRAEDLVHSACAARQTTQPSGQTRDAPVVELRIDHAQGGETLVFPYSGDHVPEVWRELTQAVVGPADLHLLTNRPGDADRRSGLVESWGAEPIPEEARTGKPRHLLWIWLAPMLRYATFSSVSFAGVFRLSFVESAFAIVLGTVLGAAAHGLLSAHAVRYGVPQMVLSRVAFGYLGNALPAASNVVMLTLGAAYLAHNSAVDLNLAIRQGAGVPPLALLLIAVVGILAIGAALLGFRVLRRASTLLTPLLAVFAVLMCVELFSGGNFGTYPNADSEGPAGIPAFLIALLGSLSVAVQWTTTAGDFSRHLPRTSSLRQVAMYSAAGMLVAIPLQLAYLGTLLTDVSDGGIDLGWPLRYLTFGVLGLGTLIAAAYSIRSAALSVTALPGRPLRSLQPWATIVVGAAVVVVGYSDLTHGTGATGSDPLGWLGYVYTGALTAMTAWLGVFLTDTWLRRRDDVGPHLEDRSHNPAIGWGSMIVGAAVGVAIGLITGTREYGFGATLVASGCTYSLLFRVRRRQMSS